MCWLVGLMLGGCMQHVQPPRESLATRAIRWSMQDAIYRGWRSPCTWTQERMLSESAVDEDPRYEVRFEPERICVRDVQADAAGCIDRGSLEPLPGSVRCAEDAGAEFTYPPSSPTLNEYRLMWAEAAGRSGLPTNPSGE